METAEEQISELEDSTEEMSEKRWKAWKES